MAEIYYVIAMTSVCDTEEGILRLTHALLEIDRKLGEAEEINPVSGVIRLPKIFTPAEAAGKQKRMTDLNQASGAVSGDYIYLYPPGIPLIVPGEKVIESVIDQIKMYEKNHMEIEGYQGGKISTVIMRG